MISIVKNTIEKEFKANDINLIAKVNEHSTQGHHILSYKIELFYGENRKVMIIYCQASPPFKPKIMPNNYIEPHKMIRLCEIIIEAFNELGKSFQ